MRRIIKIASVIINLKLWQKHSNPTSPPPAENFIRPFPANAHDGGERVLPIEGSSNLREVGGYRTQDGRTIKRGVLYRSGKLDNITAKGLSQLQALGIKTICDLRAQEEVLANPDPIPSGLTYHNFPIQSDDNTVGSLRDSITKQAGLYGSMFRMYHETFIENQAGMFGEALEIIADANNHAVIFHCTAGKDRTGILSAIILSLLGVDDEIIIADYTLSNQFYADSWNYTDQMLGNFKWLGIKADDLWPLLVADPDFLISSLVHIREHYGSIEEYLIQKGGVSADTIAQLRANLLSE